MVEWGDAISVLSIISGLHARQNAGNARHVSLPVWDDGKVSCPPTPSIVAVQARYLYYRRTDKQYVKQYVQDELM